MSSIARVWASTRPVERRRNAFVLAAEPESTEEEDTGLRPAADSELLGLTVSGQ
ncbi:MULTISPECIES: hypothetical protein [unclassified Kitasatospora]|uniref:hypothetical protein n=1 Tax=unclassified Kitasatospora TaxID=2633591 RepID=UPI0033EE3EE3